MENLSKMIEISLQNGNILTLLHE